MKGNQDFIGFLGIPFSTNVGITCYQNQIGLFKLVMCGLGERVVKYVI